MNPFRVLLPQISASFKMLMRLSRAENSSADVVFFVRWIKYGLRSGRALNGSSSNLGKDIKFYPAFERF